MDPMRTPARRAAAGRVLVHVLPGLWTGTVVALAFVVPGRVHVGQLLTVAPVIACAASGQRRCVLIGGGCALVALLPLTGTGRPHGLEAQLGHVLAIVAVIATSYLIVRHRARLARELERVREVAVVAQGVVLRPLPPRAGRLALACAYLSASRGAGIGGDLYEVLETPYGVRVVVGDVRGHGLSAVGTVAALLGCFREAAHDEPDLAGVLHRLDRALARHLHTGQPGEQGTAAEEFVTAVLLELREDGTVTLLNCGHPSPFRIAAGTAEPLAAEPLPPLGLLDPAGAAGAALRTRLEPGQTLLLHTDGAEEARDARGVFFPLHRVLSGAAAAGGAPDPRRLVETVRAALLAHAGRRGLTDDVALLALARDPAPAARTATGTAATGAAAPA